MDIVLEGVRTAVLPYPIGNQKDAFIINELLPGDVIDLKRSPASTRLPIGMFLDRSCCQTTKSVLPGFHSQRRTILLRNDRTLKFLLVNSNNSELSLMRRVPLFSVSTEVLSEP